jgi:mono/diheme cytochrome c family protein
VRRTLVILVVAAAVLAATAATESVESGKKTFERACAACHGTSGRGNGPGAADLNPHPRDLTTNAFRFRSTPSGAPPRPEDLERTIRKGLPGSAMPAFDGLLGDGEIAGLVAFIDTLRGPGEAPPAALEIPTIPAATGDSIREGRALYTLLECWRCHGVEGDGRGPSAKGLVDDEGRPIRATDFRHDPLKGGRGPADLARSILTGLNGTPMPSYGDALVFAREDYPDPPALDERIPPETAAEAVAYVRAAPSRDAIGADGQAALRDARLAALTHYLISLDERRGFWSTIFRQRPESEPRYP